MPPPNITGKLHLGHAYCFHLGYIYANYLNLSKIHGCDHAGISAQSKVDPYRSLDKRTLFEKLYEWKDKSNLIFKDQYNLWGITSDEYFFSLDKKFSELAKLSYIRLKSLGLISFDKRHQYIETKNGNVISDAEIKWVETPSRMYYIKYYEKDNPSKWITVATTRPETCFNDVMLVFHPMDERYTSCIDKEYIVPDYFLYKNQIKRTVKLSTSKYVHKDFGTGILKISPIYDERDILVCKEKGINELGTDIFNDRAIVSDEDCIYLNSSYKDFSELTISKLKEIHLIEKVENLEIKEKPFFSYTDRDNKSYLVDVIEKLRFGIFLDLQKAIKRIDINKLITNIIPGWTLNETRIWIDRARYWCLSREAVWGVNIPGTNYVFDTWFNASLWPLLYSSTLNIYSYEALITGWDLIFFWYIKMAVITSLLSNKIAFKKVFFHGLIVDKYGKKMSKTLGNVVDPDTLISSEGKDAFRLMIMYNTTYGKFIYHNKPSHIEKIKLRIDSIIDLIENLFISTETWINFEYSKHIDKFKNDFVSSINNFDFRKSFDTLYSWILETYSNINTKVFDKKIYVIDFIDEFIQGIEFLNVILPDLNASIRFQSLKSTIETYKKKSLKIKVVSLDLIISLIILFEKCNISIIFDHLNYSFKIR